MVHVAFDYSKGMKRTKTFSTVKDCSQSDFRNESGQIRYFQSAVDEKEQLLCMEQDVLDWTIKGNIQDNHIFKIPNSYVMLAIY